jgi:antitoxin component of RelBE/YafQ-DinJ toxin-antitoxin module
MNELARYMNDPDIVNEPMGLREVHAIRLLLRDETRNMTAEEHAAYINREAQAVIEKYGLKVKRAKPS